MLTVLARQTCGRNGSSHQGLALQRSMPVHLGDTSGCVCVEFGVPLAGPSAYMQRCQGRIVWSVSVRPHTCVSDTCWPNSKYPAPS